MATAAEKEALGLSADASEDDVVEKIASLKTTAEEAQIRATDAESDREEAEKELAAQKERYDADLAVARDEIREEFSERISSIESVAAGLDEPEGDPDGREVTIKIRAFPYYTTDKDPVSGSDVRREHVAVRGQTVKLSAEDYDRAVRFDAIAAGSDEQAAEGVGATSVDTSTVEELSQWLTTSQPTEEETIDAAEDDPALAQKLLDAENHATGGQPRQGVVDGLREIISAER